ncbi:deoxyribodipyrimidine photo-lyase [Shewanella cyperi]|uniref:deoxyribodipyrimidine photo-lyase n=1 Tax=Shewanella cyperi TaxID=2814292 RepID=UPI001A945BDF|nr:deoxyribodipyrimidine photo-lyase [Shewanella cyperi]QSX40019.1 deoxyribodipyrimidine photo-lyase [Shewanella cyperi]
MNLLIWFRQDLRVSDHQALWAACEEARDTGARLYALYIATPKQWQAHDVGPMQLDFIERNLNCLAASLAALGIELELMTVADFAAVPAALGQYLAQRNISKVFASEEVELNERRRDAGLLASGIDLRLFGGHCLLPPGTVTTDAGAMYRVFTPFARRWCALASRQAIRPLPAPQPLGPALVPSHFRLDVEKRASDYWPSGEVAARERLLAFSGGALGAYGQQRDFPAMAGTSSLSPYLALGVLSPRQCMAAVLDAYPAALVEEGSPGRSWLMELVWREFYRHLLQAYPGLSRGENFNALGDGIRWRNDATEFAAWCEGRTGYPIVDAAMRQLNTIGWMHNRLRMLAASFLTKHLLIDWRWGEAYFRRQLVDGDLAANNGGWQWSAGTGCDAQPYFRIFNPQLQSERFDPEARFIRHWLPELAGWPLKALHRPEKRAADLFAETYPAPIIDHSYARERALSALAVLKRG